MLQHLPMSGESAPFQVERRVPQFKSNREQLRCLESDLVSLHRQSPEINGSAAGAVHLGSGGRSGGDTKSGPHTPKSSQGSVGAMSAETGGRYSIDTKTKLHVLCGYPSSATENKSSQCRLHMRPWRTHRPSTSRIVDMSVMTERHVPVTMQLQVPAMKRAQSTMSSTQVQHIDKEVDVLVAMRDRLTGDESAHEHLADSLRGTVRTSNEVMMESRDVER